MLSGALLCDFQLPRTVASDFCIFRLAELETPVLLCGTVYLQLIQSQTSECIEDIALLQAQRNRLVELIFLHRGV